MNWKHTTRRTSQPPPKLVDLTLVLTLVPLLILSGCNLFGSETDGTMRIVGTVVVAETGAPVGGLGVTLSESSFGGGVLIRASTTTNVDGNFLIIYDAGPHGGLHTVTINDEPYDPRYTVSGGSARPGEETDLGVIELEENESP